ncbi:MAG TPA: hypothetical protein VLW86_10030, partial [Syntrophorhabdales bacterium]|nr:hypothetical protein [Syntrophorhabdales bacterium]
MYWSGREYVKTPHLFTEAVEKMGIFSTLNVEKMGITHWHRQVSPLDDMTFTGLPLQQATKK